MWKAIKEFFGVYEKPVATGSSSTVTVNVKVPENTVATVTTKAPVKTTTKPVNAAPKKRGPKKKAKSAAK